MKRIFLVTLVLTVLCMPALADKYQDPQFGWHIDGNTIFAGGLGDIRGVDYNATTNHVLVCEDDGNYIGVLSPTNGSTIKIIVNANTPDGTVDPFRVQVSDDGQIFTVGFAGSVKRIGTEAVNDAVASPICVPAAGYGITGSCRSLFVTGDWSAGTLSILTSRGPTLFIWQQPAASSDAMIIAATIATGFSTEPQDMWAKADLSEIIAFRQGTGTYKFVGSVGSGYTRDTTYTTPSLMTWRYSIDVHEDKDIIVAGSGHTQAVPGQMTATAINRYSSGAGIGDGTNGNTNYGNYGGIYTWGATGATNGAGDSVIDDTNDQVVSVSSAGVTCWTLGTSKEVLVDNLGGGDYLNVMSAVADWTVTGGTHAAFVEPYVINVVNGPYDEIFDFSDLNLGVGDIMGDIIIQSVTPGTRIHIRPQSVAGDGIRIHQNLHDVTFIDMLISPSVTGSVVTDDIVKIDENSANNVFNTVSFYNCIVTDSDASGNALITSRAEAYAPPTVTRNANRNNTFPSLLQVWGDAGESLNFYAEDCVFYGNHGQGNSLRLACDGQDGEVHTLKNCVVAYAEASSYASLIRYSGAFSGTLNVTGDDVTAGPDNCSVFINPGNYVGCIWSSNPGSATRTFNIDNAIMVDNQATIYAQGIRLEGDTDLTISDCLIDVPGIGIRTQTKNDVTWDNLTITSSVNGTDPWGILSSGSGVGKITVTDSIIDASPAINGTAPAGGIEVSNCGIGPVADDGVISVTYANCVTDRPVFVTYDLTSPGFLDVRNYTYAGAGSSGDLDGGADYTGEEYWLVDDFEDGDIDGWAEEDYGGREANGSIEWSDEDAYFGDGSMKVILTTTISGYDYAAVRDIPVSAGDKIAAEVALKWTGDGSGLRIWGSWRNPDGSYGSSASGPSTYVGGGVGWATQAYDFGVVPDGAAFFRLECRVYGTTVPATGYVDYVAVTLPAKDAQAGPWGDSEFVSGPNASVYDLGDAVLSTAIDTADLVNGIDATIVSGGFHPATVGGVSELTDGTYNAGGLTVIVADSGTGGPALVLEYTLAEDSDVDEIRVFAGHDGDGTRGFINFKAEADSGSGYVLLRDEIKSGYYGQVSPATSVVSFAKVYDAAGGPIAQHVDRVRLSFYDVSHNSTGFFQKYDDNTTVPPTNYPNQGTILKEIDIIGTTTSVEDWINY